MYFAFPAGHRCKCMCTLYTYLYLCEHEQLTRRATHIAVVAAAAARQQHATC